MSTHGTDELKSSQRKPSGKIKAKIQKSKNNIRTTMRNVEQKQRLEEETIDINTGSEQHSAEKSEWNEVMKRRRKVRRTARTKPDVDEEKTYET